MATQVSTASKGYMQIHVNVGIYIARMSLAYSQITCFFPVVKIYNCLVGSARLSRVYARPSRGSRMDRYTPTSIVEHRGLSPDNSSQKYIVIYSLYTYMWNIRNAQRAMKSAWNIYKQTSKVANHNLQNRKATPQFVMIKCAFNLVWYSFPHRARMIHTTFG